MRDEITLLQCTNIKIERFTKNIVKVLDEEEREWVKSQNILTEEKLKNDAKKATHQMEYTNSLLAKCKVHGGPFVCADEVDNCLKLANSEIEKKKILRVEILYRRHTSTKDVSNRPHLYKVNQLSLAEMKINIVTLITNQVSDLSEIPTLLTEDEAMQLMSIPNTTTEKESSDQPTEFEPKINEPCIVIWDEIDERKWYVAMCRRQVESKRFLLEHLQRVPSDKTKRFWRYPLGWKKSDEQIVVLDQIIPVNVFGAWNLQGRSSVFELDNWHVIDGLFQGLYIN